MITWVRRFLPFRRVAQLAMLALLVIGCASGSSDPSERWQRCTNDEAGFAVSYPPRWFTNDGDVVPSCSAFHPDAFEIPYGSEMPFEIAIVASVDEISYRELAVPSRWDTIESARATQLVGRGAVRVESTATGEGLAPAGLRTTRYGIDLGQGRTLVFATHDAEGTSYDRNRRILDEMVRTLSFER